jgi:hypothetical protein
MAPFFSTARPAVGVGGGAMMTTVANLKTGV